MMSFRIASIILFLGIVSQAFCQTNSKKEDYIDGTIAFTTYQGSLAIHYTHLWKLGKAQKFSIGLGARLTSYLGNNQYYSTAPSKLTSNSSSPLIFFQNNIEKNIDTLIINTPHVTMLNISLNMHYQITKKISAGFTIDATGFSVGTQQQANYINGYSGENTTASPTPFNLLLISDNDRGSLNSEIFVRYKVNNTWGIKGGFQFLFTEYTTTTKVQTFPEENDRFRNKSSMIALGVSYKLNVLKLMPH